MHKGQIYPGQHEAIIGKALWDQVQEILAGNVYSRARGKRFKNPSPLTGILFDDMGNRMSPSHSQKGPARYRYYISQAVIQGEQIKIGSLRRIPAFQIEAIVAKQFINLLTRPEILIEHLFGPNASGYEKQSVITSANMLANTLGQDNEKNILIFLRDVLHKIVAGAERVSLVLDGKALRTVLKIKEPEEKAHPSEFTVSVPIKLTRLGRQECMVVGNDNGTEPLVNKSMVLAVARAIKWDGEFRAGTSLRKIAKREGVSDGYVLRILPLAFLAPDIVQAIYDGRQPLGLKVKALSANLPLDWTDQRRSLGFSPR